MAPAPWVSGWRLCWGSGGHSTHWTTKKETGNSVGGGCETRVQISLLGVYPPPREGHLPTPAAMSFFLSAQFHWRDSEAAAEIRALHLHQPSVCPCAHRRHDAPTTGQSKLLRSPRSISYDLNMWASALDRVTMTLPSRST